MSNPPSSLPSPTSSASSHHLPFAMSITPHTAPARAPSAVSHVSGTSGQSVKSPNQSVSTGDNDAQTPQLYPQHTFRPPPQVYPGQPYIPPITSSPPPHTPAYVPPPQHALPPDPIHSHPPFPQMQIPTGPAGMANPGMSGMGWSNGPTGLPLNQWRPGPAIAPYPPYRGIPNGPVPAYDGFPQTRNAASMGPLSHGMPLINGIGRPGSAAGSRDGMSRERRRDRSHQSRGDDDERGEDEVISTIFVVGFPDDMSEREFQNIFTFAPGFEAATLKFPSGSNRSREPTAAFLAELAQVAAAQQAADPSAPSDFPLQSPAIEEALAALQFSNSTSSVTTPSAAMSLTPSALSASAFGAGLPSLPSRRQTIGFARFKTRQDALHAKEQLQGKKIDSSGGGTLKAEMAKKNLHTKRNAAAGTASTGQEEILGMLMRSGKIPGPINPGQYNQQPGRDNWEGQEKEGAYPPYSANNSLPTPTGPHAQGQTSASAQEEFTSPSTRPSDSKAFLQSLVDDDLEGWNAVSMGMTMEGIPNTSTTRPNVAVGRRETGSNSAIATGGVPAQQQPTSPIHSSTNTSNPLSPLSPATSHSTLQRDNNATNSNSGSNNANTSGMNGNGSAFYRQMPNGGYGLQAGHGDYIGSPTFDTMDRGIGIGVGPNPADQNPPINTLYVGNLPAISPPTHPPNFLEESLRGLFSRCQGYKRMSYRQKINGPMCFVEFEDIPCAAQAIKDLYGNNLSGLVKGGIRLSYSKNSLGQRGNGYPGGNNASMFGGIAHTVALAGMSSPSANNQNGAHQNGQAAGNANYGLQLNTQGQGQHSQAQSAPIPMPGDLRRESVSNGSSGLSPTAQPFNTSLPLATSPRSRYFGSSPNGAPGSGSLGNGSGLQSASYSTTHSGSSSNPSSTHSQSQSQPIPLPINTPSSPIAMASGSIVSSPIRTPASFSWVSSGSVGGNAAVGNGGYGFDPFSMGPGVGGMNSLSGAASAWQQGGNGGTPMS